MLQCPTLFWFKLSLLVIFIHFADLLTVAPGLTDGMTFSTADQQLSSAAKTKPDNEQPKVMTLADLMTMGDDLDDLDIGDEEEDEKENEETEV